MTDAENTYPEGGPIWGMTPDEVKARALEPTDDLSYNLTHQLRLLEDVLSPYDADDNPLGWTDRPRHLEEKRLIARSVALLFESKLEAWMMDLDEDPNTLLAACLDTAITWARG